MIMNQKGISIIEALVSISLIAMISMVLMGLFVGHLRLTRIVSESANLLNQRVQLEQEFDRFVHLATRVVDTATVNGTSYTSDSDTLVLEIPSIGATGFVLENEFDYVAYYLDLVDPEIIRVTFQPSAMSYRLNIDKQLSDRVKVLLYTYDDPLPVNADKISIKVELERIIIGKKKTLYLNSLMVLRNKPNEEE